MNISKERLLEIENELNDFTIKSLTALQNLRNIEYDFIKNLSINKLYKCPHCNIERKSYSFRNAHFDNCKWKGINLKQFNIDIQTMYRMDVCKKYDIDRKWIRDYARFHKILLCSGLTTKGYSWKQKIKLIELNCPHCKMKGHRKFKSIHFDNCKWKGINLEEFNKELIQFNSDTIIKKYNINRSLLTKYINFHNIKKPHWKLRTAK